MKHVVVLIGAGSIGLAIARRVGSGKHLLIADINQSNLDSTSRTLLDAGFEVSTIHVDIRSRTSIAAVVKHALKLGNIVGLIHAAGVSPSQASPEIILEVDLYGTALILEEFGKVISSGGSGIVISSQSGHRLPALSIEEDELLALTPADDLLMLPMLSLSKINNSLLAYQYSKRGNALRVKAEAVKWGKRGARINSISPGIIITPLANDELNGPRGETYRRMLELSPAGRAGTPDEVANLAALLMSNDGAFITGSDFLIDGGVTASYFYGELKPMS